MFASAWLRVVVGALLVWTGAVWALQGVGVLPGSFMSGQRLWLMIGLIAIVVGLGLAATSFLGKRNE